MHRRTARGNRLGLAVLGVLLLAGGAALVLAYLDVIPDGSSQDVYPSTVQRFVHDQQSWLFWVLGIVSALIALWFLRWLLVQTRVDRVGRVRVDSDIDGTADGEGRTVMPAGSATAPVEDDIESYAGVRRARADLAGSPDSPELWVTVLTDSDADLGAIRTGITDQVVPDARTSWELPDLPAYLTLVVGRRAAKRRDLA